MKISAECELMENHKNAIPIPPNKGFRALQSGDGTALLFSIGNDTALYLTRELPGSASGWDSTDISCSLPTTKKATVKKFRVAQNPQTHAIDVALVVTIHGSDSLYQSVITNTSGVPLDKVTWTELPFSGVVLPPGQLNIGYLYLMSGTDAKKAATIFIDLVLPAGSLDLPNRFSIVTGDSPSWKSLFKFDASRHISSHPGQRSNDTAPGLYTFSKGDSGAKLTYSPPIPTSKIEDAPKPISLNLPAGASAVAPALNSSGATNLFVTGTGGLFLFSPDNQQDSANPVQIVSDPSFAKVSSLVASTIANRTAVWGLDADNHLIYLTCPAGDEKDSTAWSSPVPLEDDVTAFAFFVDRETESNVLFANRNLNNSALGGPTQELIQLSQDPVTTSWQEHSVLLTPNSVHDVVTYDSFTTHIQVMDDNGIGAPNTSITIKATNRAHIFINDVYYSLKPGDAVNTTTDITGVLTVIQETHALSGCFYNVTLSATPDVTAMVNPIGNAMATLSGIHNGSDLGSVQIPDGNDGTQPLLSISVPSGTRDAAAKALAQFVQIHADLPQDGSQGKPGSEATTASDLPEWWGVSMTTNGWTYHENDDVKQNMSDLVNSAGHLIETTAGDFLHWAKHKAHDVDSFVLHRADDAYHFIAKVGGKMFHFTLNCLGAVGHAVQFVLKKLQVEFDRLIAWLGLVFEWKDILQTHAALKTLFNNYLAQWFADMEKAHDQLIAGFQYAIDNVDRWAHLPTDFPADQGASTSDGFTKTAPSNPSIHSPKSNWALHHFKSNAASASTTAQPSGNFPDDAGSLFQTLWDALKSEEVHLSDACTQFQDQIVGPIKNHTLTLRDGVEKTTAILTSLGLETLENILLNALDLIAQLPKDTQEIFNAAIQFPVLSWIYKHITRDSEHPTGDDMTLMDLVCLIVAIPVTVVYKSIALEAPFSPDASEASQTQAPSPTVRQNFSASVQSDAAKDSQPPSTDDAGADAEPSPREKRLALIAGITAFVGALPLAVIPQLKAKAQNWSGDFASADRGILNVFAGVFYLPYCAPDIFGDLQDLRKKKYRWFAAMNEAIAGAMIGKNIGDMVVGLCIKSGAGGQALPSKGQEKWNGKVSPWWDFIAGVVWMGPTVGAISYKENWNASGVVSCVGNVSFNFNGMMSLPMALTEDPRVWLAEAITAGALNVVYGTLTLAAGILTYQGEGSKRL